MSIGIPEMSWRFTESIRMRNWETTVMIPCEILVYADENVTNRVSHSKIATVQPADLAGIHPRAK